MFKVLISCSFVEWRISSLILICIVLHVPPYAQCHHSQENLNCLDQRLSTKLGGSELFRGSEPSWVKLKVWVLSMLWTTSVVQAGTQWKAVISRGPRWLQGGASSVHPGLTSVWKGVKLLDQQKGSQDKLQLWKVFVSMTPSPVDQRWEGRDIRDDLRSQTTIRPACSQISALEHIQREIKTSFPISSCLVCSLTSVIAGRW